MSFALFGIRHSADYWEYDQAVLLRGNSLNNPYLRMNLQNREGICLGLAASFLLYAKRCANQDPWQWVYDYIHESSSGWYAAGSFYNVSDLQTFIGRIMEDQRSAPNLPTLLASRIAPVQQGMWNTSLRFESSCLTNWGGNAICGNIIPHLRESNKYWLIALRGHAIAITMGIHPETGSRLFLLYEPNHGIVQFNGITSLHKLKDWLVDFAASRLGAPYAGSVKMYRFF
ncbi:hypothetical protein [Marinibactrum halimedae]|uniref:hypothetical protein n=1 Tax=Marinibactrum halimedae TaxID=1444977 RepID=UPI001E49B25C|nr:hypothetical protein [Marinibactrum halimedae]MCD9458720.1 hypothetical protein [Marinibactrum halimedae]